MSDDFKERLKVAYAKDRHWKTVIEAIHKAAAKRDLEEYAPLDSTTPSVRFFEKDDLLYYVNKQDDRHCLYVLDAIA